jgi:hypothetical protein
MALNGGRRLVGSETPAERPALRDAMHDSTQNCLSR